jgi:D-alanine-D-alanine ligase
MVVQPNRTDLPVLIIYNIDPAWLSDEIEEAMHGAGEIESALRSVGHPVASVSVTDSDLFRRLRDFDPDKYIVLNWCEELPGVPHSEAMVAQTLASLKFTYTGSPAEVLALSWDRNAVKRLLHQHGIPTPRWRTYSSRNPNGWNCFPAIVKPSQGHCSYGITGASVVETQEELTERIGAVTEQFDRPALVEDFIDGREFHVSLWGNRSAGGIRMLPPAEMEFSAFQSVRDRLCTYDSKHRPGSRHYEEIRVQIPAMLNDAQLTKLEQISMEVYQIFGCVDYARLDIRLRRGRFYVLDVNPNPDITLETSIVKSAELAGYSYGAMVSQLINLAALRHPVFGKPLNAGDPIVPVAMIRPTDWIG